MQTKKIYRLILVTAVLLMVPWVAMQFTEEVKWTLGDFLIMGALIFGTGLTYELITQKVGKEHRFVVGVILAIAFLYIWAELAVGVFTNWGS